MYRQRNEHNNENIAFLKSCHKPKPMFALVTRYITIKNNVYIIKGVQVLKQFCKKPGFFEAIINHRSIHNKQSAFRIVTSLINPKNALFMYNIEIIVVA